MNPIFKPTPLTWEDIEGGLGEVIEHEICEFVCENCYPDEPKTWDTDENLTNDLIFFAEEWEQVDWNAYNGRKEVSTPEQTAAVLSLICGAFHSSMAYEEIVAALTKSATKPRLVEIMCHVASAYCQYITLKARLALAEAGVEERLT